MNPAINQDFGNHKQSVRMCIETEDKNFRITGESIHVIEITAVTRLQAQLAAAKEALARLSLVGPPRKSCAGSEIAQIQLEDNCAIAKSALAKINSLDGVENE